MLWNLLVFVLLLWADRKFRLGHGRLFALYVAAYCVGRFGVELLRDDTATHIAGIRINVFTAAFVFIGAVLYLLLAPKGREDPETLRGWEHEEADPQESVAEEWAEDLVAAAKGSGIVAAATVAGEHEAEDADAKSADGPVEDSLDEAATVIVDESVDGDTATERTDPEIAESEGPAKHVDPDAADTDEPDSKVPALIESADSVPVAHDSVVATFVLTDSVDTDPAVTAYVLTDSADSEPRAAEPAEAEPAAAMTLKMEPEEPRTV